MEYITPHDEYFVGRPNKQNVSNNKEYFDLAKKRKKYIESLPQYKEYYARGNNQVNLSQILELRK